MRISCCTRKALPQTRPAAVFSCCLPGLSAEAACALCLRPSAASPGAAAAAPAGCGALPWLVQRRCRLQQLCSGLLCVQASCCKQQRWRTSRRSATQRLQLLRQSSGGSSQNSQVFLLPANSSLQLLTVLLSTVQQAASRQLCRPTSTSAATVCWSCLKLMRPAPAAGLPSSLPQGQQQPTTNQAESQRLTPCKRRNLAGGKVELESGVLALSAAFSVGQGSQESAVQTCSETNSATWI